MSLLSNPGGGDAHRGPTASDEPSLREILAVLHRRSRLVFGTALLLTGLCALVGFTRQPSYTATATLIVEPRGSKVVDLEAVVQRLSENAVSVDLLAASVHTHIGLIESDKILDRAVAQLGPEAVAAIVDGGSGHSWMVAADVLEAILPPAIAQHLPTQWLAATTGRAVESDDLRNEGTASSRTRTIDKLRRDLKLQQVGRSYILAVSYRAKRPEHAALVANSVAEAYVASQLAEKRDLTERASVWLASEAQKLGAQVLSDEQAAEVYRAEQDLAVGPEDTPLDAQQLATLTTELINARADVTSKEARLRRVQAMRAGGVAPETMADVLNAPLIATLREQELGLMREQVQLAQEYGSRHPRITLQEAERRRYTQRIRLEVDNAIGSLDNEVQVARSRVEAIEAGLVEAKGRSARSSKAGIELTELERNAAASRALYEHFLVRLKETQQQQGILEPEVRVASPAEVPDKPSSLPPLMFVAAGLVASMGLGPLLAFLTERMDGRLRNGRQLRELLGARDLGLVPVAPRARRGRRQAHSQMLSHPHGAFAEAVRGVLGRIQHARDRPLQVLLLTSSLPGEGKTTLACSLAIAAAQLERRTLLVDLDLRRPRVGYAYDIQSLQGVAEVATGEAELDEAVSAVPGLPLDILAVAGASANPLQVLLPHRLEALFRAVRARYDLIIVDTPPALGVADTRTIARYADSVAFVVRWDHTKHDAAEAALRQLELGDQVLAGAVLNLVDMKRQAKLAYGDEGQYFHHYRKMYRE